LAQQNSPRLKSGTGGVQNRKTRLGLVLAILLVLQCDNEIRMLRARPQNVVVSSAGEHDMFRVQRAGKSLGLAEQSLGGSINYSSGCEATYDDV
jgi:hypothetical protein